MNWLAKWLPYYKLAQWLLAELGWQKDVEAWLLAEKTWYFTLAAQLWDTLTVSSPVTVASLQVALANAAAT